MSDFVLGLDASTSTIGYCLSHVKSRNGQFIVAAGFIDLSKHHTIEDKMYRFNMALMCITCEDAPHVYLEEPVMGFRTGKTTQQTIVNLAKFNATLQYSLRFNGYQVTMVNANTARKRVFGRAGFRGVKPKDFVRQNLPRICPMVEDFRVHTKRNLLDKRNDDMYDAVVLALYGAELQFLKSNRQ
jgi:Holliday junction resolvasome RuvABC endonuclease subunit